MAYPALDGWLRRRMELPEDAPLPTPEAVRRWQFGRIAATVGHAHAHSPFYRDRLANIPFVVNGGFPAGPGELEILPRMSAEDLRTTPERLLCASRDEVARVVTLQSSGTTGEPKRVFYSAGDLERTTDFFANGMRFLADPGDAVLVLLPGERPGGVARMLCEALGRFGARGLAHGPVEDPDATVDGMLDEDVRSIVGSPAHVNTLARAWAARGLPRDRVRSVLLCWDMVPNAVAANLRAAFGCRVLRHWGMVETGLGGAVECDDGSGMHLREADLFVEITNPETGRNVPAGEVGEIVVTTLSRRAMPLIRYRTGDLARLLPAPCPCGSPLRRLGQVLGRLDDVSEFSLAALNEALYAVEGIADFTASLEQGAAPVLRLRLSARHPEAVNRALDAAGAIPAVRSRLRAGTLRLAAENVARGGPAEPGLAKRRLHQLEPDDSK